MLKMHNCVCIIFLIAFSSVARSGNSKVPDSLITKEYDYYIRQLAKNSKFPSLQKVYANAYLSKAKAEKNWEETMYAYKELLHVVSGSEKMIYGDSMIIAALNSRDKTLLGSAYLTKGIVLYDFKKYREALKNYLIANDIISKTNDHYLLYKIKFNIAQLKYFIGEYDESAGLFRECIRYFAKEEKEPYINSLHSLGMCYIRLKQYGLCTATNELGIKEAVTEGYSLIIPYFLHSEGINQFHLGNYAIAIGKLKQVIPVLQQRNDFANKAVADFYIGKSYMGMKNTGEAIPYFMKIDTAFRVRNFVRQDFRESYEILISYYNQTGNHKLELLYAKRLIDADKLLDANENFVVRKLSKGYDHKVLSDDNATFKNSIGNKDNWIAVFITSTVTGILGLLYVWTLYNKNKAVFSLKYDELINKKTTPKQNKTEDDLSDISPEILELVLQKLKKFEADKKYLDKGLTQARMARRFNTNTTYISRIVYRHSAQKFTDYINNLRINHIITLLETENRYRNYSTAALADEACFNSKQNFVAAFRKKKGVSPGEYVKDWIKNNTGS